jgi:hypothetical protein
MEKNTDDRYRRTTTFVLELEACLKGKTPWVLTNNPAYLHERMLRKMGADRLLQEGKYREGRESIEEFITRMRHERDEDSDETVEALVESWSRTLDFYRQRLAGALSELSSRLGACGAGDFVKCAAQLLELICEVKVLPAERRAGDRFPSSTDQSGKWALHRGSDRMCGYWVDILRTCGLDAARRIESLKEQEPARGIRSGARACLLFADTHPELFMRHMENVKELFEANGRHFVPQYDKDELDSRGRSLGGTLLGVESMTAVEALFRANECSSNGGYAEIAKRQVDAVVENLMRKDGSVFRFGIFDGNGRLIRAVVDKLAHLVAVEGNADGGHDRFEDGVNVSRYTSMRMQAHLIEGLVAAYVHTVQTRYKTAADKAITFFMSSLPADLISHHAVNGPDEGNSVRDCAPTAIVASSLLDYAGATKNKKARKTAIKLLQALVKNSLDVTEGHEGILHGCRSNPASPEKSHVESDRAFVASLLKVAEDCGGSD